MKEKLMAIGLLVVLILTVYANTLYLTAKIDELCALVESIDFKKNKINEINFQAECVFDEFKDAEKIISLTVSHTDLTNIEDCFVEMIGYLSVEDIENAEVIKSRLINSLKHLRRLSGFNFDSIF